MYKKEFDSLPSLPHYMLFYGDDFYLQEYEEKLKRKFKNANLLKIYFDEYDFEKAKSHLQESSLFGGENVLIIKHNKIPPKIEKLIDYAKENYLFFFYYGDKKPQIFGKNFVRFFPPTLKEAILYLGELENEYNVKITQSAKQLLAKTLEPSFFRKEIEKLSLFTNEIDTFTIEKLTFLYKEESLEDIFVLILNGEDFFEKIEQLLEVIDYRRIIPSMIRYVRELIEYHLYIKTSGKNSLEEYLGYKLPKNIEIQRINLAIKFKEKDLKELLKNLMYFELEMRLSNREKKAIFWEVMSFLKIFCSKF